MRTFLVALSFVSATVFGSAYNFPILQKTIGGMDTKDGVVISKTCQIFDNQSELKLDDVLKLILDAEKANMRRALHFVRQVPSVEIWANYPTRFALGPATTGIGPRKVLLFQDASAMDTREGAAAEALLKIVDKHCKNL